MIRIGLFLLAVVISTGACAPTTTPVDGAQDSTPGTSTGVTGSQESDWKAIERLEGEAKSLAIVTGCTASEDCRSGPVGSRACGGPRYYLPYCAKSTDSAALFRKLDEVAKAEQAFNAKHQVMSTCEMRLPPTVEVAGGSCVTKPAQ